MDSLANIDKSTPAIIMIALLLCIHQRFSFDTFDLAIKTNRFYFLKNGIE